LPTAVLTALPAAFVPAAAASFAAVAGAAVACDFVLRAVLFAFDAADEPFARPPDFFEREDADGLPPLEPEREDRFRVLVEVLLAWGILPTPSVSCPC
jgi:hypothetical protein